MHVLILSPYHGGSHRAWAAGYTAVSAHDVSLLTLPDRFWKWRMHGGAVTLARRFLERPVTADLLLATDMLDLTTFLALTRTQTAGIPTVLYMHENQLTYPLPADGSTGPMRRQLGERDQHYAFVNYASMLAADAVWFNSHYHLESLFDALPRFLKHFPEYNELGTLRTLHRKSRVMPLGVDLARLNGRSPAPATRPPLVLWNQRWEYDKRPEQFFDALFQLADEGVAFRLAVCGQQFGRQPAVFAEAARRLQTRIVHWGYAPAAAYRKLLWQADVTASTAVHEFFGISMLEAIYTRTFPVLPARLSYPELLPDAYHAACLYDGDDGLVARLRWALTHTAEAQAIAAELATVVARYDWSRMAPQYDAGLTAVAAT